jgi:hypothetical protein
MKIRAMRGKVLVTDLDHGERMVGRIIIPDDNRKMMGVRDRWAQVYSVGEDVDEIQEGDWILLSHGRWTRKVKLPLGDGNTIDLWSVDWPDGVLIAADTPTEGTLPDIPDVPTLDR